MKKLNFLVIAFLLLFLSGCGGNGKALIKGNISSKGEKIYHVPGGQFYESTKAEKWFKTELEAQKAGFRKSKK